MKDHHIVALVAGLLAAAGVPMGEAIDSAINLLLGSSIELNEKLAATAAPNLLKIVKSLDAMWTENFDGGGPDSSAARSRFTDDTLEIWRAIRAAIADHPADPNPEVAP